MANSNIPKRFPTNLAMLHLTPEEIEQFRDVSLADMAIELRRRIAALNQPTRDGINAHYDELIDALHHTSSGQPPSSGTLPDKTASDEAPAPDAPCDSVAWNPEEQAEEERSVRRRLNDDTPVRPDRVDQFEKPQFLGKTPVKDIATLIPTANLSTHMSKMYIDQVKAPIDNIPAQDRLDNPNNLDMLARFIYQVHEYFPAASTTQSTRRNGS